MRQKTRRTFLSALLTLPFAVKLKTPSPTPKKGPTTMAFDDLNKPILARQVIVDDGSGNTVTIGQLPEIDFGTPGTRETTPAKILAASSGYSSVLIIDGARETAMTAQSEMRITSYSGDAGSPVPNSSEFKMSFTNVRMQSVATGNAANDLIYDGTSIRRENETWNNFPFAGTWTDVAGARGGYYKDATGRVQLRGQVSGGGATLIGTLPLGYRPQQSMEWVMRAAGGVILCAVLVATDGTCTVTANAATAEASGIRLDSISFPTA